MIKRLTTLFVFALLASTLTMRCATDPGASTPVSGGSVFKYDTGTLEVRVKRAPGSRDTAFDVYSLAFDSDSGGSSVLSTSVESTATLTFSPPTGATLTGCASATPTYVGPIISAATYTVYQYTGTSCSADATLSLSASATATNTTTGASRVLGATGSGGASSSGSGFSGWTKQTVFLTSTTHNANFGGLSGADSFCSVAAASGSKTSSLSGSWKAILSSTTSSAASRLTLSSSLPVKNTNDDTVVTVADQLWGGSVLQPIDFDQDGIPYGTVYAHTATLSNGTVNATRTCTDWTMSDGSTTSGGAASATDGYWINQVGFLMRCNHLNHLYCINVP